MKDQLDPGVRITSGLNQYYDPAAEEAVKLLLALGYVYAQTEKGLAWIRHANVRSGWYDREDSERREFFDNGSRIVSIPKFVVDRYPDNYEPWGTYRKDY